MKTTLKIIVIYIALFFVGIAAVFAYGKFVFMPRIANDISKFAYEGAYRAYVAGYEDGANGSRENYDRYFDEDTMREIANMKYYYIK